MAQDFESNGAQITNSNTTIFTSNSDDAIVGIRLANTSTSTITADVAITDNSNNVTAYLIKNAPIVSGGS